MHNSYWLIWNGTCFLSRKWAWAFQITTPEYRLWLAVLSCSTIFYKDREGHKDGKVKNEAKTFWFSPDGWNESPVFINIVFLEIDPQNATTTLCFRNFWSTEVLSLDWELEAFEPGERFLSDWTGAIFASGIQFFFTHSLLSLASTDHFSKNLKYRCMGVWE